MRNPVTAGLSSTSFCWIASALLYSASASDGLPVCASSQPRLTAAARQAAAEVGDGEVVVGQLLLHRQRLAVLGLRLRRLARLRQQQAERLRGCPPGRCGNRCRRGCRRPASAGSPVPCGTRPPLPTTCLYSTADRRGFVAVRQISAEIGDRRGCRRPASVRSPAPCGTRPPLPLTCPHSTALAEVGVVRARLSRKSVTAGSSSASFCTIASPLRHSASASADLPIYDSRLPRLLWMPARLLRNW